MTMDFNPLWILVALAVLGSIVKGLFWLRDVHNMKEGWQAFAKEIRGDIKKILERIPPPKTLESASPLRLSEIGEKIHPEIGPDTATPTGTANDSIRATR